VMVSGVSRAAMCVFLTDLRHQNSPGILNNIP
jgi:hypothetical protein